MKRYSGERSGNLESFLNYIKQRAIKFFSPEEIDRVASYIEEWYGKDVADWFREAPPDERRKFVERIVRQEKPWKRTIFHRRKRGYYWQVGDRVKLLTSVGRGRNKVPAGIKGLVVDTSPDGRKIKVVFSNGTEKWVDYLDVEFATGEWRRMPTAKKNRREKMNPTKKKSVDEFAKSYWRKYLEGTGLDKELLKVAFKDVGEVIEKEDELSPVELYNEYKHLGEKYKDKGGIQFIRRLRAEMLRHLCRDFGIASIFVKRSKKVDEFAMQRDLRGCYHIIDDDLGIFHFENPSEFRRVKAFLDEFEADYVAPDGWLDN